LKGLDHLEIGDVKFLVLGSVEIFFCYKNTLYVGGSGLSRGSAQIEWKAHL
jgi:hypothetical protein